MNRDPRVEKDASALQIHTDRIVICSLDTLVDKEVLIHQVWC